MPPTNGDWGMRTFARTVLVFGGLCLTAGAARAQSMDIPLNLTLLGTNDPGTYLTINIGINGQAPRPYIFDTGSELFVAQYTASSFGSVPESQSGLPQNQMICYGNNVCANGQGYGYYYNIVGTPSLTFYPSYTSTNGGVTLNAVAPSGAASQFLMGTITSEYRFPIPDGPLPGGYTGGYGIFGAGNFLSKGPGGVLGQAVIPGTTAGYVVAANGQPLSAVYGPGYPISSPNGPQVGQSVTSCSPCVMLGLTPAVIAQFMPVNTFHTNDEPKDGTFANSNVPATIESPLFWNISVGGTSVSSRSLLDSGTSYYQLSNTISTSAYANGGVLTISGPNSGATASTVTLINNNVPLPYENPYYAQQSNSIESIIGLGFFLQNSVLYNLAGEAIGYTSNFVTDVNIATTSASPLIIDSNSVPLGLAGVISGSGPVELVNGGSATLSGTNTYTGATTVNNGFLALVGPGSISMSSGVNVSNGGIFDISGVGSGSSTGAFITSLSSTDSLGVVQLGSNQLVLTNANGTFAGSIQDGGLYGGTGGSLVLAGGIETLTGINTYTGGTIVLAGTLQLSGAGTLGAPTGSATLWGGVLDLGHTTQTLAALFLVGGTVQDGALNAPIVSMGGAINGISGPASLTTFAGVTFVLGTNTYTGGTNANGGVLDVIGSLSDPTVNAGGYLMGTGTIGATQVNAGGIFAPGNGTPGSSMTVAGNLAFQSGAVYLVQIGPAASFANVTGTATLGGASLSVIANGSSISKTSTILTAAGGVSGSFGAVNTNLSSLQGTLSYGGNNTYLNLALNFGVANSLNGNQQAVGNALTNYFNATGGIPTLYAAMSPAQLSQASGEATTGTLQTTFDAMNQFINLLTDPFMGRGSSVNGKAVAAGYAEEDDQASAYAASRQTSAYAMFTKAPLAKVYEPRWSVWAASFGGSQSTEGNALVGSNSTTSSIAGTAVGADYLLSPRTIAGLALAGGGTSFSVVNSGGGRSDLFQAGAYVRHTEGNAYIAGALAYGWQDITTDRYATIAGLDHLSAEFNANAFSGRVESGYRFVAPWMGGVGITPYAAGQFTTFDLPAYAEGVVAGAASFALNYGAQNVTDARSELGIRTDKAFALASGVLTLRGRFAWAHDFDPDRAVAATFQALPGASFVVNGASQASDSALTTAAVEMKWMNGWSAAATFEGEFSQVTASYAGKGVVRYVW